MRNLVAIADDGHTLVWKAHRALDIETGQRFTIGAATIKAHETYRDTDQTVITRATKFEVSRAEQECMTNLQDLALNRTFGGRGFNPFSLSYTFGIVPKDDHTVWSRKLKRERSDGEHPELFR
jgi:hypothetical protein